MKPTEEIIKILRAHQTRLKEKWPIKSLALFGSVARGEQTEKSDIDLLIELADPIGWSFFDLIGELEGLLGSKVDLVERTQIKPKAWSYIQDEILNV